MIKKERSNTAGRAELTGGGVPHGLEGHDSRVLRYDRPIEVAEAVHVLGGVLEIPGKKKKKKGSVNKSKPTKTHRLVRGSVAKHERLAQKIQECKYVQQGRLGRVCIGVGVSHRQGSISLRLSNANPELHPEPPPLSMRQQDGI